ncbi:hypothetical protein ACTXT7_017521 [Hymenolepis weldensis]
MKHNGNRHELVLVPAVSQAGTFLTPACLTQPSEPILFPRLRIKYADFPYLHYSSARGSSPWRPDADMGTACHENHNASLGFSRADKSVPDTTRGVVLYGGETPISGQPDSRGGSRPYKEKKTLPGTLADVSEFVCVAALDDAGTPRLCTESPDRLGPPDPWPTAVPMEPFSTSAFKVLT